MKKRQLIFIIFFGILLNGIKAQSETIVFGQQKAINTLSSEAGLSSAELNNYLKKRYQRPLFQLTVSEGADLIQGFQDGTLTKASITQYVSQKPQKAQIYTEKSPAQKQDLVAASILEVGMKKRFHFKDGSISEGEIIATYGLDNIEKVGQVQLADFVNEHGLKNIGNARFQETPESGAPTFGLPKERTIGKIQAGFLEKSNTDITDEIVLMLRTQRAFNGCSKLLQSEIDITKKLSQR